MQTPNIDFDDFLQWTADDNITNQLTIQHSKQISPKFNICCYEDKFLDELNKFRLEDMYTDVRLLCQGKEYSAHKMILASGSGYFHDIFTQRRHQQQRTSISEVVEIKNMEPYVLELIITYLYTGKLHFCAMTQQIFRRFMQGASQLKVTAIQRIFLDYMINHVSPVNYNYVLQLATSLKDKVAEDGVVKYLVQNIETVWLQPEFSKLPEDHLAKIFSGISKSQRSHDLLLLIMFMLLENNPTKSTLYKLQSYIDFQKVSIPWAKDLLKNEGGSLNAKCKSPKKMFSNPAVMKDILRAAVVEYKRKGIDSPKVHIATNSLLPIKAEDSITRYEAVLIIVGLDRANRTVCTNYRFIKGTWSNVEDTGTTIEHNPGVGLYDDKIFFIGGEDNFGNKLTSACYYDIETKELEQLPNIGVARSSPAVCYYKNNILVAGGLGRYGLSGITFVEKLTMNHDKKWSIGQPLRIKRGKKCHGLVLSGKSVITGGGSLQCEYFNWKTRVWSKSDPLPATDDELFVHAGTEDKLFAFQEYKPELIYELDFESGHWTNFRAHGSFPECIQATTGWKTYVFAVDKSRIVYVLNITTKHWYKNCKLPVQMVRAIYMGLSKQSH